MDRQETLLMRSAIPALPASSTMRSAGSPWSALSPVPSRLLVVRYILIFVSLVATRVMRLFHAWDQFSHGPMHKY
ncbi:hypothetical protein PTI98_007073 [Pleurotus ostreatus]|nr:hypothetical protein PTI98_007073 [Pleurotus ostreatus]